MNNVELPSLEMKKKQLDELRNFYKPIEHNDFIEHSEKYERLKNAKNEEIRRNRE